MFIKRISLNDGEASFDVVLEDVQKLNMLVGLSGSGKTTILRSIKKIVDVAKGESFSALEWDFCFLDNQDRIISWKGKFDKKVKVYDDEDAFEILYEELNINDEIFILRDSKKIVFNKMKLPKLNSFKSILNLFKESEEVRVVYSSVMSLIFVGVNSNPHLSENMFGFIPNVVDKDVTKFLKQHKPNIKKVSEEFDFLDCREKMYYASIFDVKSFDYFEFVYTSIFSNVERILIEHRKASTRNSFLETGKILQIKLSLISGDVVEQSEISSGMFKTMMLLADIYFSSDKSCLIIDEIENGLGINCLPDLLQEIKSAKQQVIMTSHHPKIINEINMKYWKVVGRDRKKISTSVFSEGESQHESFIKLINSNKYKNGVK